MNTSPFQQNFVPVWSRPARAAMGSDAFRGSCYCRAAGQGRGFSMQPSARWLWCQALAGTTVCHGRWCTHAPPAPGRELTLDPGAAALTSPAAPRHPPAAAALPAGRGKTPSGEMALPGLSQVRRHGHLASSQTGANFVRAVLVNNRAAASPHGCGRAPAWGRRSFGCLLTEEGQAPLSESPETLISCCRGEGPCADAGWRAAIAHELRSGRCCSSPLPGWGAGDSCWGCTRNSQ